MDKGNDRSISRPDVPDADAAEQQEPLIPDDSETEPEHLPPEAAEADYVEQHLPAHPAHGREMHSVPVSAYTEASEADLAEQAAAVPLDEEEYPYGTAGSDEADF
jgi:hypothetical protein